MRLTVVLTVHDGERFLGEAIDSVLAQSRGADEIIAVDDGSRDGSAGILASYAQIRVIAQAHSGCAVARNRGVAAASGDVVALLDQDDVWDPDKLRLQIAALEADPALGFAVCAIRNFLTPGLTVVPDWVDRARLGLRSADSGPARSSCASGRSRKPGRSIRQRRRSTTRTGSFAPSMRRLATCT